MLGLRKKKLESPADSLKAVLKNHELPPFPAAVLHILKVLRDPDTTVKTVGDKIQIEAGLVVRILRMVNSAAFGLARPVDTIPHAIALLGRSRLESIVLGVAVKDVLPRKEAPGYQASRFWRAAARRATLAREFSAILHPATQAESFTAALLQDMALPVLATVLPERYGPVLEAWHGSESQRLERLESEAFGWDHTEIGGCMATVWELPERLALSIGGHHDDGPGSDGIEPAVRLAGFVRESLDRPGLDELVATAEASYGMKPDQVIATVKDSFERAEELASVLS